MTSLPLGKRRTPNARPLGCFWSVLRVWGVPPGGSGAAVPCPGLACPASRAGLRTSSSPDRGREGQVVCWKPLLFVERPAQPARTHNPTPIHISSAWLCNVVVYVSNGERKQRARKPPLRGVWGVNPQPQLRIVGVVGAGLHADASAR